MKMSKMQVVTRDHFISLIKDLRESGFHLITFSEKIAELENENEFIIIEIV